MPRAEYEPIPYLTKRGRKIFFNIVRHIEDSGLISEIDNMELSMLANAFDLFEIMSKKCNDNGYIAPVSGKNGTFDQVVPEYGIMKQQYDIILKHSPKFGLNPGDREKIFNGMAKKKKKESVLDGLD